MSNELTPWFPASVKPTRKGVYNVHNHLDANDLWFSYWDGKRFNWLSLSQDGASQMRAHQGGGCNTVQWRGLAKKP